MTELAVSIRNLSKCYKLGTIGRHTLVEEAQYWWHKIRGQDPRQYMNKIGYTATEARRVKAEMEGNPEFWALKDITFDVQPGEVVGIIGRNGAGKSTLLKILTRITEPTFGEAIINGRIASLLEVGTGFHPELTGRENIYMNGAILGMKKREIDLKLEEIVTFSELETFIDTPVKRYSSGMYVRLAFAVAAHLEPEILLVDEVLAVGDTAFQKKCLGKMGNVAKQGRTILFVSHNMGAVESLCPKTILMESGSISSIGETKEVVNKYLSSTSRVATTHIAARTDRRGAGKLVFDDIAVDDSQIRNRKLRVDLSICNQHCTMYNNILLSVVINDHRGRPLSNLVNYIIGKPISVGTQGAKVRLKIKNLNLVPGTYSLSPFLASGKQNGEIFDWVDCAAQFDIPDYDYYHKGEAPYIKGEAIYLDYEYEAD